MTRDASAETVKGDFNDAVYDYQGLQTRLTRHGDRYIMETVDPQWALLRARAGDKADRLPPPVYRRFRVDRLVGSHWVQECLHREPSGRYVRLPVLYHIVEKRWVHANGAFLAPDSDDFWDKSRATSWNDTCLYCHNTGPSKNPRHGPGGPGYDTKVAELGISCEACHGPGGEHVRVNANPARRLALQQSKGGDASVVHPERLSVARRDEVCARCHGALVPKAEKWDRVTQRDPFVPGQELGRYNHFFWSEAEQRALAGRGKEKGGTEPIDGRFWGDGTPLTTALEYNGMALSACYLKGQGQLSCLSCHTMHGDDPNYMLKPGMATNEACYQCHGEYRSRLAEHTRHPAGSAGSLCYNCHMPHQVYSLLTTHRSHRIETPHVADSLDTGKPHACNLCHLDRSFSWTQEQLARWPRAKKKHRPLTREEKEVSSALLHLARGDGRTRAVVAGAFSRPEALRASGADWFGPVLTRLMEKERYPIVRYLAHRGLRAAHGDAAAGPYDYLGTPATRAAQLKALRERYDAPVRRALPHLPFTRQGGIDEAALGRLLDKRHDKRHDPDVTVNE
jgi:predicted CXXCH cytochrome family protein